jgi:hypothetical protein
MLCMVNVYVPYNVSLLFVFLHFSFLMDTKYVFLLIINHVIKLFRAIVVGTNSNLFSYFLLN